MDGGAGCKRCGNDSGFRASDFGVWDTWSFFRLNGCIFWSSFVCGKLGNDDGGEWLRLHDFGRAFYLSNSPSFDWLGRGDALGEFPMQWCSWHSFILLPTL